jgi:muramoyltetrapeptide carboxypeptidase
MGQGIVRIGVVAPASRIEPSVALRVTRLARRHHPGIEIVFSPQCFLSSGHFAGDDETRREAFAGVANDPSLDALWFARGGYGCCRLAERLWPALSPAALDKTYLGYSDAGFLLAGLYNRGCRRVAHGPMPSDVNRQGGAAAVLRALAFLEGGAPESLEPSVAPSTPAVAFNMTVLAGLLGTPLEPDLTGHVLMLEEVAEPMYRIDRCLFQLTSRVALRRLAGIRLGRCGAIAPNQPDFGQTEDQLVRHWCDVSGIPYLGRADIGHDIDNKVVPFGRWGKGRAEDG